MEAVEEQIITKTTAEETALNSGIKSHNPGLRALLAIKSFTATLEKDYTRLLLIESDLDEVNKKGLLLIEATAPAETIAQWKTSVQEVNNAVKGINDTLTAAKEKIAQKAKDGYPELWKQLAVHLTALKENSKNTANTGLDLLPEAVHPQWEEEFVKPVTPLLQSIITHVESCRVLLQMIERYTPDELNTITQIIADQVPLDFTYEEAVEYQNDYYKALINFKKEFKQKKNLWDKFLDILAGGTHQPPSERVMMERWLDGEKGDL
ncbi:hypothetical protein [Ferruginibacter sp.]|nr:hypothetical protein [Ferruginibacter sp.]